MTYYTFAKTKLLNVDNTFARLIALDTDTLTFEFAYSVSQVNVIHKNALKVHINVYSRAIDAVTIPSVTNAQNAQNVVPSLLTYVTNVKKSISDQKQYILASKTSDVSAYVNNAILSDVNSGYSKNDIFLLQKTKLSLVQNAAQVPTLTFPQGVTKYSISSAETFINNLLHDGVDPSNVVNLPNTAISANESVSGISSNVKIDNLSSIKKLQDYYIFPEQISTIGYSLVNEPDDTIVIFTKIVVQRKQLLTSKLYIKFDLTNTSSMVIDTITKDLDTRKYIQLFSTPTIEPSVFFKRSSQNTSFIEIIQNDKKANSIIVYRKNVSTVIVNDTNGYFLLGTYNLNKSEKIRIPVDECTNSFIIYRIISANNQIISDTFTNVVVTPRFHINEKTIVLNALQIENGIKIQANHIPVSVVSVEIVVKNLTYNESDYKSVDQNVHFIKNEFSILHNVIVVDNNVSKGNVYEYAARLTYATGEKEVVGSCIIEYIKSEVDKVFTTIQNVQVNSGLVDVSFDVSTNVSDTDNSNTKALLEAAGITQYDDLLIATRSALNVLIAHNIQRVDLTTGERSDFGIITTNKFSDKAFSKNNSVKALLPTHTYRYEVMPLLRASDTLFYDLTETATDKETQKSFSYSPAKYLNPLSLDNGTLYSKEGIKRLNAKDQMSYGAVGNIVTMNASFNTEASTRASLLLERVDSRTILISWRATDIASIDHFIVTLNNVNVKTIVGRVHSQSENCQFIHSLTRNNIGELRYGIVPVYNDYTIGTVVYTNSIIVESI